MEIAGELRKAMRAGNAKELHVTLNMQPPAWSPRETAKAPRREPGCRGAANKADTQIE
jgi:hypothetical protein